MRTPSPSIISVELRSLVLAAGPRLAEVLRDRIQERPRNFRWGYGSVQDLLKRVLSAVDIVSIRSILAHGDTIEINSGEYAAAA